jgi:spermidine synthase
VTGCHHWVNVDRAFTEEGAEVTLATRNQQFVIRVDGEDLMHSDSHGSEEKLALHGCAGLGGKSAARVLIGGLGMGFTARAALRALAGDAKVEVVELVGAVVRWNRELLGHLADDPLTDPRLRLVEGDVVDTIARSESCYDAILLDVDNGPQALSAADNDRLYTANGLGSAMRALRRDGVLAVWSVFEDASFTARLREVGFRVTLKRVRASRNARRRNVLWLARSTSGE